LIFHQRPSNLYDNFDGFKLMIFDGIAHDAQIASSLKFNKFINLKIYFYNFFILKHVL
jgi:hypothetical protein